MKRILVPNSDVVALIKPQFEAGREQVGKNGIVRNPNIHKEVIEKIINFSHSEGYEISDLSYSPITGGEGNIEFLIHLKWPAEKNDLIEEPLGDVQINHIVKEAHKQFTKSDPS